MRLEDTLDGTSEAGLLVTEVITWPKINITVKNFIGRTIFLTDRDGSPLTNKIPTGLVELC